MLEIIPEFRAQSQFFAIGSSSAIPKVTYENNPCSTFSHHHSQKNRSKLPELSHMVLKLLQNMLKNYSGVSSTTTIFRYGQLFCYAQWHMGK